MLTKNLTSSRGLDSICRALRLLGTEIFAAGRAGVLALVLVAGLSTACAVEPAPPTDADPVDADHAERIDEDHSDEDHGDEDHGDEDHAEDGIVELSAEARRRAGLRVEPVARRVMASQLRTTGEVDFDPKRVAHVAPRIEGRIHRVEVELGDTVRAGEALIWMDSVALGQAKSAYLTARSERDLARINLERVEALFADGIAAHQRVLEARAALEEGRAELLSAAESLRLYGLDAGSLDTLHFGDAAASLAALAAPFDGTVVEMHATLGERVEPSRNLLTVADLGRVWIWIDVYQRDLARVHVGDEARAVVDAFPGEIFTGTVSYLGATLDEATRTVRAKLEVPNPSGRLRPGMFVDVEILDPHGDPAAATGGAVDRQAVRVLPESALVRLDGRRLAGRRLSGGPGRGFRRGGTGTLRGAAGPLGTPRRGTGRAARRAGGR